uniref:(northern house mosquito) hypothetical protein n=1 Tax=Culex pipiens TaxID=7175 RepID=A0A8D8BPD5_CULPI
MLCQGTKTPQICTHLREEVLNYLFTLVRSTTMAFSFFVWFKQFTNYVFYCGLLFREENHTSGTTATLTYGQQQHFVIDVFFFALLALCWYLSLCSFPLVYCLRWYLCWHGSAVQ